MTESDAYERVEKAVRSIERNLTGAIDPERAADAACFSLYHFHRLFPLATGETPGCYIRKRRLSESARELVMSDRRILEIALSYGFGFSIDGEEGGEFFYLMAVEVLNFDRMPVEMLGKVIPESEYAVFTVKGLSAIKDAYTFAYGEWLPRSGWKHTLNFDYEFYGTKFANPDDPNAEFEICIPVVKIPA